MIPIATPKGTFRVWTKRVGNNPRLKVLLLHGGPGATHEYLEACDSYLPAARASSTTTTTSSARRYSDQPDEPSLWELDRFVDEVEQVRAGARAGPRQLLSSRPVVGRHARDRVRARATSSTSRGSSISNMMASVPAYNAYAEQVLMPAMDQAALAEIKRLEAERRHRGPALHGAADRAPLRPPRPAHAARGVARARAARASRTSTRRSTCRCRARASSASAASSLDWDRTADLAPIDVPDARHRRRSTTRWTRPTWRWMAGAAAAGPLPALPGRQPPGDVRRPGDATSPG